MSKEHIRLDVEEMFREILDLPSGCSVSGLTMLNEPKWDSLAAVSLVAAIESSFGIVIDSADHEMMTSFASTWMLLQEKLAL